MKTQSCFGPLRSVLRQSASLALAACLLPALTARAVTFTNDTVIGYRDTNYDGTDIIVTNCTLTVDGPHSFASLQILSGANLTHTYAPGGQMSDVYSVTNEPYVLSATNAATLANSNLIAATIVVQDLTGAVTYTNDVDYLLGMDTNGMTTVLLTPTSAIAEGSTNLVSYDVLNATFQPALTLAVTGDVAVAVGGMINADSRGYGPGMGPGAGRIAGSPTSGSGAGHGGYGGQSVALDGVGQTYGSLEQPVSLGSGGGTGRGGPGGIGGGSIQLVVGGTMRVDGTVSANGASAVSDDAGGGSGGSIWITAHSFAGAGFFSASGGAGEPSNGGGGGGGRISLQYEVASFPGAIAARGGSGFVRGGAGTIYTRANGVAVGQALVDNGGRIGGSTALRAAAGNYFDLTVQQGAIVAVAKIEYLANLLVASNAWLSFSNASGTITITNNATIRPGGGIIADGTGYAAGAGTGFGRSVSTPSGYVGGGAGHGGYGAAGGAPAGYFAYGGSTYDSLTTPLLMGSGGGNYLPYALGGGGGGVIVLNVSGMLLLDGRISADGMGGVTPGGGGGAGGSVMLTVGTLAGAGTISANGGMGNGVGLGGGGGGGGGRVAVLPTMNLFFGTISARGSTGAGTGGAGTIYTKTPCCTGVVLADNGGQAGTNTAWVSTGSTVDVTVKGGAVVAVPSTQPIDTLLVASNGWVSIVAQTLTISGNATVQAGGGILADGTGSASNSGSGAGRFVSSPYGYIGGGGGYGGFGAAGGWPTNYPGAYGGSTYGSIGSSATPGSGGGGYVSTSGPSAAGGAGGGAVTLVVTGVLQVDGRISASGLPGAGASGGGGSGGGIYINAGTLTGSGVIAANGGMGNSLGGGGGGGRITIYYGLNGFTGLVSAYGGGGASTGGAGTVYFKASSQPTGLVMADNAGQAGTNTTLGTSFAGTMDLTIKGGAVVAPIISSWPTVGTLLVASNGWLVLGPLNYTAAMTVSGSATIQAGGGIISDGTGYPAAAGPGMGRYYTSGAGYIGGGAGYGGYGGAGNAFSAFGGITYGSATAPTDLGSGGGPGFTSYGVIGGAGGGNLRLTVTGTLQVDGRISARGGAGIGASAGGGSGGTINLTVGTLSGSGVIAANGGAGNALGGGGGGGRVGIAYTSGNSFSGLVSAYGGTGYVVGGAGTVYVRYTGGPAPIGPVIVDNGGLNGTNTGWPTGLSSSTDLTVRNGGALAMPTSSQTIGNLLIASNGWINVAGAVGINPLTLTVNSNATIQAGGGIVADYGGYSYTNGGLGPCAGAYVGNTSGGGGFGGCGGASGGSPSAAGGRSLGLVTAAGAGSAGGGSGSSYLGGNGGGGISLNVLGTLLVDGRISSAGGNGVSGNTGGGAGGGIALTVGTLVGSGVITANGGAGNSLGGGGGGGRIAISYNANAFGGSLSAYGGSGYLRGGAGTIYTSTRTFSAPQVLVDNGGQMGTNTSWTSGSSFSLTVTGGGIAAPQSEATFANLLVASNGWVSVSNQMITVTSSATVRAGGGIIADSKGYGVNAGPGAGKYVSTSPYGYLGGGGGHGGYGASAGTPSVAYGGTTYGSVTAPLDLGSGGGTYNSANLPAGVGGGIVRMNVTGALLVNGRVSAAGGSATGQGSGGGAGGSVWLTVGTLAGSGTISANGGAGNGLGGGGGGGCVALNYGVNAFAGTVSAYGGGGGAWGGAGTIYTKATTQALGQMLVDNGGHSGTNTPVGFTSPLDLSVRGGAVVHPSVSYLVLSNLSIGSGGILTCLTTQTNLDLTVLRNASIDLGGAIAVDGKGYAAGTGPGAGLSSGFIGSGAGHGGNGGASSNSRGGPTYDSEREPVLEGSGGGVGWGAATNGEGGGAIRLTVGGTLALNGRLSANGNAGTADDSGGGSGGSIWASAGALAGTGAIAADGGAGELYDGGGGGGGRIAIYTPVNVFAGLLSAAGGSGYSPGEPGSISYGARPTAPQVVSSSPSGVLTAAVSSAQLVFSSPVDAQTLTYPNLFLTAPGGVVVSNISASALNPYRFQLGFDPPQTAQGDYTLTVGPQVLDLFGQPLSQVYTGAFTIAWATVQGTVTDTNGLPVADVVLQPDGGVPATTTDTNGNYVLGLPPAGTVQVAPSKPGLVFLPASRTYTDVTVPVVNENYLAVTTIAPTLTTQVQTNNLILNWYGLSSVTYQPLCSTNLVDWAPYGGTVAGTNGPLELILPMDTDPMLFYRLATSY
jgi:hypothetical protein